MKLAAVLAAIRAALNAKPVKDFVLDFLMGVAAGSAGVTAFGSWADVHAATLIVSFSVFKAFIQAGFRAVYKWAQT